MNKRIGIILLAIVTAFVGVKFFSQKVFIANTPEVNPNLLTSFFPTTNPQKNDNITTQQIAKNQLLNTVISRIPLQQVATGVQAGEDSANKLIYVKIDQSAQAEEIDYLAPNGKTYHLIRLKQ